MNLFTTSAGIVLIGLLTLTVTRPSEELVATAPPTRVTLGVYDARALADRLSRIEDELPRIAREAGVDAIVSSSELAYRVPESEVVDVTRRMLDELASPR